ncbi:MAG: DUF6150 family protein [Bacteroidota bacterium]|nr:DUF6150 family protein [Bacteroidota bacterium]
MRSIFIISLLITFAMVGLSTVNAQAILGKPDPCKIYGKIYFEPNKQYADYRVYVEEDSEAFAQLMVFKTNNKFFADKNGLWYITTDKREADYWLYLEPIKGQSDFTISYINTESFAGCK